MCLRLQYHNFLTNLQKTDKKNTGKKTATQWSFCKEKGGIP